MNLIMTPAEAQQNRRPCCQDRRNRLAPYWGPGGVTIEVCKVCRAKHTRLPLEPGKLGVKF